MRHAIHFLTVVSVLPLTLLSGCGPNETRWNEAQQKTRGQKAVSADAFDGSALNKYFPKAERPWDMSPTRRRRGPPSGS